jgi:hypothetical protein
VGLAFENFVSSGSDERNVAVDFLKRRDLKESPGTRAYIQALRNPRLPSFVQRTGHATRLHHQAAIENGNS